MITVLTAGEVSESARAFLAAVSVAPEVLELRPDYRVLVMTAEGLEPGPPDQSSEDLLAAAEARARTALDGRAPEDVPEVADWRDAYRAFGAKPQRTRPSVEAPANPRRARSDSRPITRADTSSSRSLTTAAAWIPSASRPRRSPPGWCPNPKSRR